MSGTATTWGRTAAGKVFAVPQTHDMLENLFSAFPPTPATHTWLELLTLSLVAGQSVLFVVVALTGNLESWLWRAYFTAAFLLWRMAYNFGLGLVLKRQSDSEWFTALCRRTRWFDKEAADKEADKSKGSVARMHRFIRNECTKKMSEDDYNFDVRFNLISRNDFPFLECSLGI